MLKLTYLFALLAAAMDAPQEERENEDIQAFKRAQSWKEMVAPALYDNEAKNKDLNQITDFSTCFLYPDAWAWRCFLDGYTLVEARDFKKHILRLMHEALVFYIYDFEGSYWRQKPEIKTRDKWKTKEEFVAWILDVSDQVYDWLERNEAIEVGFFPSMYLGFLGEPTAAERERIISQFEKALCLAGPSFALYLYPGDLVTDAPFFSQFRHDNSYMPHCVGGLSGNMRLAAIQVFERVYGTFHQLSVFCHKSKRWVLDAEAKTLRKVCLEQQDWHLYNHLVEGWLDRRVEVASWIRELALERGHKNLSIFVPAALKLAFDYILRPRAHPEVCICYNDPATYLYAISTPSRTLPNLAQQDHTKFPLKELNEDARRFFDVTFPMLKKRQQDVVEFFELLLLPEGGEGFLRLLGHCEEVRQMFERDPSFYITSTDTVRYPVVPNVAFNGESLSLVVPAREWTPLIRERVLKLREEDSESLRLKGDVKGL